MAQVIEKTSTRKTHLTDDELNSFKKMLLNKRADVEEEIEYLRTNLENMIDADDNDQSSNAHHIADIGTDQAEIQMYYKLIERSSTYVNQLNRALERIENKTYGICRATGKPIPKGRLEAVPHTRYGIEAKRMGLDKINK